MDRQDIDFLSFSRLPHLAISKATGQDRVFAEPQEFR